MPQSAHLSAGGGAIAIWAMPKLAARLFQGCFPKWMDGWMDGWIGLIGWDWIKNSGAKDIFSGADMLCELAPLMVLPVPNILTQGAKM